MSPDIGTLSCLKDLDLRGNSFISLPGSLSQLSCLRTLNVDGCEKLEVLPQLPCSISSIQACYCTSLQELPLQLVFCRPYIHFMFSNSPKLFRNLTIEIHVPMSQPQLLDSSLLDLSITSHCSSNQFSSFICYVSIQRIKYYLHDIGFNILWKQNSRVVYKSKNGKSCKGRITSRLVLQ